MILTIPLKPKVASRARVRSGQGGYNTPKYAEWLKSAAELMAIEARREGVMGITQPVEVRYGWASDHFTVEILASDIVRPKGLRQGDNDNFVKAGNDALQRAGVIENDKQVVALSAAFITEGDG